MRPTSASQRMPSSPVFFTSPLRRLEKVTCRLVRFSILWISIFPLPISSSFLRARGLSLSLSLAGDGPGQRDLQIREIANLEQDRLPRGANDAVESSKEFNKDEAKQVELKKNICSYLADAVRLSALR
jgi:hypothetical protein